MDLYPVLKTIHIFGAVLLLGNIIVTAWWKNMADKNGDPKVVAFAQRQVTLTDFVFTAGGTVMVLGSGIALVETMGLGYIGTPWLKWALAMFIGSGLIWMGILLPIQIKQARMAKSFADSDSVPEEYKRLSKLWNAYGSIAVILPVLILYFMIFQP